MLEGGSVTTGPYPMSQVAHLLDDDSQSLTVVAHPT